MIVVDCGSLDGVVFADRNAVAVLIEDADLTSNASLREKVGELDPDSALVKGALFVLLYIYCCRYEA